jgi:threonyl-tRNA synthetase
MASSSIFRIGKLPRARTKSRSSPTAIPTGLYVMRHSTAHVLAQALRHLYGTIVQYTIGPVIENGFFYDFRIAPGFSADELPKVEKEMQKIIDANLAFSREDVAGQGQGASARREPAVQG